jgi:hypothetical protein
MVRSGDVVGCSDVLGLVNKGHDVLSRCWVVVGVIMVVVVLVIEYRVLCELAVFGCDLTGVSDESDSVGSNFDGGSSWW